MRHCHFSILYNELPFLKQKLPFLYENFSQLIFYDLNIHTLEFSDDGGHEYIANFPDPENKITLIDKKNLDDVEEYDGLSFVQKQKMFAVGSRFVRDDIDVFWCTDMDEFFSKDAMKKVETEIENGAQTVNIPNLLFFKNEKYVFCIEGYVLHNFPWVRICKHKSSRIYGHCNLNKYTPTHFIDEILFHFVYVGNKRVKFKSDMYKLNEWYENIWKKFDGKDLDKIYNPVLPHSLAINKHPIPEYINIQEMMKDLC
jgi:hypothetical protein